MTQGENEGLDAFVPEPGVHRVLTGGIQPVPPKETGLLSTVRKWGVC